ncbi:helix-turn-helix domain-containing protein [uncultured Bacteroides sp.]|uniref:helix-turn-helix domain-containing protein n=1 Tax=uncultured Bacteroides sp. TaxID=162156 RepID=UPI002AABEF49|nr:helix-turn-helix domain-containing protein [uncultured Bacteroides sp.]
MDELVKIENISQYNTMLGLETLHPLVAVIDFSKAQRVNQTHRYMGLYTLFLKDVKCGDIKYGRNYYDYQEGTLVFIAPGQIIEMKKSGEYIQPKGWALLFHPDLIHGTSLGHHIKDYSFFSYESYEALHLSDQERQIVIDCLHKIDLELRHAIDKHSKKLIVTNIELLLNYCVRFYDRQFLTRSKINKDILIRFEKLLDNYFLSNTPSLSGLPTVGFCAEKLHLSPNYFGDLIKKETGKSPKEHIQLKLIDVAKERILDTNKSVSEVAYELGFKYPQHFTRMFKKSTGISPNEFRNLN